MFRITCATVLAVTANAGKVKDLAKVDAKKTSIITMNQAQSLDELALGKHHPLHNIHPFLFIPLFPSFFIPPNFPE